MPKIEKLHNSLKTILMDSDHNTQDVDNVVITALLAAHDNWKMLDAKKNAWPISESAVIALLRATELKDPSLIHHSVRVAKYAALMAGWLSLSPEEARDMVLVSLLHDVGKMGVPDEILKHPGTLELKEFEYMKRHAKLSGELLSSVTDHAPLIDGVTHHHERVDGFGYPDGLSGADISLHARVCLIVDSFDAMTSNRPYRVALPINETLLELKRNAGHQFDKDLAHLFISQITEVIQGIEAELGIDVLPKIQTAA